MRLQEAPSGGDAHRDGFGRRYSTHDPRLGPIDELELIPALGTPASEQAIRAAAQRVIEAGAPAAGQVVRVARRDRTLVVSSNRAPGVPLPRLLAALDVGAIALDHATMLGLAAATMASLATLHRRPGAPAHGALCPSHVMVQGDGSVVLTGAVFADALEALQWNRDRLWRELGLAMPPSASLPRFDQRADVTQAGALVIAMLMRRPLNADEYPKHTLDLVDVATGTMGIDARRRTSLRLWLHQTLQLNPRSLFRTAGDAGRALAEVAGDLGGRAPAHDQLQAAMRVLTGEPAPVEPSPSAGRSADVQVRPEPVVVPARPAKVPLCGLPRLRGVFSALRTN